MTACGVTAVLGGGNSSKLWQRHQAVAGCVCMRTTGCWGRKRKSAASVLQWLAVRCWTERPPTNKPTLMSAVWQAARTTDRLAATTGVLQACCLHATLRPAACVVEVIMMVLESDEAQRQLSTSRDGTALSAKPNASAGYVDGKVAQNGYVTTVI